MDAPERDTPAARRRKLFVYCDEIGLTRRERIELARAVLWRDVTSYSELDDDQVARMLDALEGHILINALLAMRP